MDRFRSYLTKRNVGIALGSTFVSLILRRMMTGSRRRVLDDVPFTRFLEDLRANRVSKISMQEEFYRVVLKSNSKMYSTAVVPLLLQVCSREIVDLVRSNGVHIIAPTKSLRDKIFPFLLLMLPFVYLVVSLRMLKNQYSSKNEVGKRNEVRRVKNQPRFRDVAGIDTAKAEMMEIVHFLKDPRKYRHVGAKLPKGILLWGPSGTGKTLLARAVATEANVAFFSCSASDFVEMLVGRGAARVRDLFQRAAKHKGPAIVFIDEIDALGKARGGLNSHDEREQTLNQLLVQMDGFESTSDPNSVVIVIAATNRANVLDSALIRPGRFDRHVRVGLPDMKGREAILRVHARKIRLSSDVDFSSIAKKTNNRSGAELACLVNEAALLAVRQNKSCVDREVFEMALKRSEKFSVKRYG